MSKEASKRWREKHPDRVKSYRISHKEQILQKDRNWRKNNPEKVLGYQKAYYKRHGQALDMRPDQYDYALLKWSKTVRYNNVCVCCNTSANLIAHHIFYKSNYPLLSLNINNGITLCVDCHGEFHTMNGYK